ncbi:MAG: 50S ribosomal protein L22 [Patescibacteria group bacterium]
MKASLKNYRQSPRKVRLVADFVKGRNVEDAISNLAVLSKRASLPIKKLIQSAVSSAKKDSGKSAENLYIKEFRVDKGVTMKRSMPRAMGSASRINKRSSNVLVILEERPQPKIKNKK